MCLLQNRQPSDIEKPLLIIFSKPFPWVQMKTSQAITAQITKILFVNVTSTMANFIVVTFCISYQTEGLYFKPSCGKTGIEASKRLQKCKGNKARNSQPLMK